MKRLFCEILGMILASGAGLCQGTLDLFPDRPGSLTCWTEIRTEPRALRIHYLKIALNVRELGCSQSINLDGGGSSIMLIREGGQGVRTVNSLSDKSERPVPVMLRVRGKKQPARSSP